MKKLIIFLLAMLFSLNAFGQTTAIGYPQQCVDNATHPTSAQWLTCTQARAGTTITNPIYTTSATASGSQTQWYTGTAWASWTGQNAGVDNLSNSTPAPFVYNLNLGFDGTTWDRLRVSTLGDAYGATPVGLNTASLNLYYDGTNYRRLLGGTLTDNFTQPTLPYQASFLMVWDGSKWDRMTQPTGGTSGASGDAISATQTGLYGVSLNHFYNGTNFKRWLGEAVDDSMTEAPVAPWVAAYGVYRNLDGGPIGSQRFTGEGWDSTMSASPTNLNTNAFGVFYNNTTNRGTYIVGSDAGDTIGATGPIGLSIGHFYNGSNYQRWKGEAWDTDMANTTNPNVNAFGVFKDNTTGKNAAWYGEAWDSGLSIANAPSVIGLTAFYNGSNGQYWTGEAYDANMTATPTNPNVNAFTTYYNISNSDSARWSGEIWDSSMTAAPNNPSTNAFNVFYDGSAGRYWNGNTVGDTLGNPVAPFVGGLTLFYDGTNYRRWLGAVMSSDAILSTTVAPYTGSFLHAFNGTNWVRVRMDGSNNLSVVDTSVRAGEDVANGYRKVKVEAIATSTPAKQAATAVANGVLTTVLNSRQVVGDSNFCIYVKNLGGGGAAAFVDFAVQTSPDDSSWTADIAGTTCNTTASGVTCVYCVQNNAYNYIRAQASGDGNTTTADAWYVGNKG